MTTRAARAANAPELLRIADDELQRLRGHMAAIAAFIHDPTHDLSARHALARHLQLPHPAPTGPAVPAAGRRGEIPSPRLPSPPEHRPPSRKDPTRALHR
ncbi:hypothetical protein ACFUTV_39665 [Streptomyces sp. NPDC057298]|uniref:hypothetical protein n=1 Tax=Streptomyces sp. NPDC057298 TaxID=3346091 RepID=UPI003624CF92